MALLYHLFLFPEWQTTAAVAAINIPVHTVLIRTSGEPYPALSPERTLMNLERCGAPFLPGNLCKPGKQGPSDQQHEEGSSQR